MGDSFVAYLWFVLIITGNVVAQKFGEYGNAGWLYTFPGR